MGAAWEEAFTADRPDGELAMSAYLGMPEPMPTGIEKLDQLLGGGMTRGITVVGGGPGAGKTVTACMAASRMAARGQKVVYASYETAWEIVQLRCASAWSCYPNLRAEGVRPFNWGDVVNGSERRSRREYDGLTREQLSRYTVGSLMDPITHALTAWDEGPGRNLAVLTGGYGVHELCEMARSVEGEPPVLVDGETVVQVTYAELLAIKDADKRKKPAPAKQANSAAYVPIKGCTTPPPF